MRWAWGSRKDAAPTARHWRKAENEMALARPSKVGALWASKGCGSMRTAVRPALARARARVVPAMPAPAMMTSASPKGVAAVIGGSARLFARQAHHVEPGIHVDDLTSGRTAQVRQEPQGGAGHPLH